jgi:thioredoxin reductase (NADPH)
MPDQDLRAVAFPTLRDDHMAALGHCAGASLRRPADGEVLFRTGDRDFKFFVVESGTVEIVDDSGDTPGTLAVLRRGEFTGDVSHLTGGPAVVSAVARGDSEVYEVSADGLRQILNRFPDLGDMILQAFIARRQLLRDPGTSRAVQLHPRGPTDRLGARRDRARRQGIHPDRS